MTHIDDVVEALPCQLGQPAHRPRVSAHLLRAGIADHRHLPRRRGGPQFGDALKGLAGIHHHQQPTTSLESASLAPGVGRLDARPRFDQRHRRTGRGIAHRNQESRPSSRIHDHPLVEHHVLLQRTLEVVAEGGFGTGGGQVVVVGLHQHALSHPVVLHLGSDGHDPAHRLVPGHDRTSTRLVAGDLGQHLGGQPRQHLALARMLVERVQQLGVRETDTDCFSLQQQLVRAEFIHGLGRVVHHLVSAHELDRVLGGWEFLGHG